MHNSSLAFMNSSAFILRSPCNNVKGTRFQYIECVDLRLWMSWYKIIFREHLKGIPRKTSLSLIRGALMEIWKILLELGNILKD